MQPYLSIPQAADYLIAMNTYVSLVQAYNQKILTFDALVIEIAALNATINLKQAESARISNLLAQAANQDPNLADYVAYMDGVYQDILTLNLRYLYETNSALNYYTLSQQVIQVGTAGQPLSMADIANVFSNLNTTLPGFINGNPVRSRRSIRFPVTLTSAPTGTFSTGDPFAAFIAGTTVGSDHIHAMPFTIPLGPGPVAGRYRLVATAFSVSVPGFKTPTNTILVRLTHSGRAPFLGANGNRVEFTHSAVEVFYAYEVDANGKETQTGGGALGSGPNNPEYIGLSPCTAWLLEVRESDNPGLDLSAVQNVMLNFSGLCRLTS